MQKSPRFYGWPSGRPSEEKWHYQGDQMAAISEFGGLMGI